MRPVSEPSPDGKQTASRLHRGSLLDGLAVVVGPHDERVAQIITHLEVRGARTAQFDVSALADDASIDAMAGELIQCSGPIDVVITMLDGSDSAQARMLLRAARSLGVPLLRSGSGQFVNVATNPGPEVGAVLGGLRDAWQRLGVGVSSIDYRSARASALDHLALAILDAIANDTAATTVGGGPIARRRMSHSAVVGAASTSSLSGALLDELHQLIVLPREMEGSP